MIKGSNIQGPAGNLKNNGFLPLSGGSPTCNPPNSSDNHRNGSFPQGASGGLGVTPPNEARFSTADKGMSGSHPNPTVISVGKGAIPVGPPPFGAAMPVAEMPRGKG